MSEVSALIEQKTPGLSLVLPTTGKERNLFRVLDSLRYHAPASLLKVTELIVFVNVDPISPVDHQRIDAYLSGIRDLFYSVQLVRATCFHLTAEESALAAVAYATGGFLWIVGDKRIFLPEGLMLLDAFIRNPTAACAYFNSVWSDSEGQTNGYPSTHMVSARTTLSYKQFVMRGGINFMATNMGAWVYRREALDPGVWGQIIRTCGPHFSHVTALLAGLGDADVLCHSAFLLLLEAKAYHAGDASEWDRYSSVAGTYRFYAWTFGLVRQFRFLIERGDYTYADVRRSLCSEANLLRRQIVEIYIHLVQQIEHGRRFDIERITEAEFQEIMAFLEMACPENAILHGLYKDLYAGAPSEKHHAFSRKADIIKHALGLDHSAVPYVSPIVGQIGDLYVRLHPGGYVMSKVRDNKNFLLAYKLLDPPEHSSHWQILTEAAFSTLRVGRMPLQVDDIYPHEVHKRSEVSSTYRVASRRVLFALYRNRSMPWLVSLLPPRVKRFLRARLL